MSIQIPPEAFSSGILDKNYHAGLLADLDRLSAKAGIPPFFVWSRLSDYCSAKDIEWVRRMREVSDHGLIFSGTNFSIPVADKMMAIAGACLRNHINARVMTVQDVVAYLKADKAITASVVLVPNFSMAKGEAGIAHWQAASLLGWLYSRLVGDMKTILYVGSFPVLEEAYGEAMARHLKAHYHII